LIRPGYQLGFEASIGKIPDIAVLNLVAGANASAAKNTLIAVNEDEGIWVRVNLVRVALATVFRPGHVILIYEVL